VYNKSGDLMEQIIFHIDVNNAFLSWSAVDLLKQGYPIDIRSIPAVIGGDEASRKGIVLAKSMPAKKRGVMTAETLYSARSKVKNLQVFPPNYHLYSEMSKQLFTLLLKYIPYVEKASIDEGYFNYSEIKRLYGDEISFAYRLKDEIKKTLGFTVNIGIANTKLCAKMASDFSKPDKVHTLFFSEIKDKLWPLPVGELFTVGKQTALKMNSIGIYTIRDLANADISFLRKYFKNQAVYYRQIANGIDDSKVKTEEEGFKCISHEFTFGTDLVTRTEVYEQLEILSDMVAKRLRESKKHAYTICVVIKDTSFKRMSHQKKLTIATDVTNEIFKYSKIVFNEFWDGRRIRLLGIRLDDLVEVSHKQLSLFDEDNSEKDEKIDKVIDEINKKYAHKVIHKASLVNKHYGKR